jgi:hypothetical protein
MEAGGKGEHNSFFRKNTSVSSQLPLKKKRKIALDMTNKYHNTYEHIPY